MALYGVKIHHTTSEITTYKDIQLYLGWPYIARVVASIFSWLATIVTICNLCCSNTRVIQATDNSIMAISADPDFDEQSLDETENGTLL